MDSESLIRSLRDFLTGSSQAVVLEEGTIAFDLSYAKYSVSGEHGKCLLHLWSAERNIVRRVLDAETKNNILRLSVQRLGQARPSKLEICRERDRRSPSVKRTARAVYRCRLQRILERIFPGWKLMQLSTAMDLERSFGPIYSRGLLRRGRSAFAVLGVNQEETQASIDAALSSGILWLDACRQKATDVAVEGLTLFVPAGSLGLTRDRIAHLNAETTKWQLYEFNERDDAVQQIDCSDRGNVVTRLVYCPDEAAVHERFAEAIVQVRSILSEVEVAVFSTAEIAFRLHGLELARARLAHDQASFRRTVEIVFGLGPEERVLDEGNSAAFQQLLQSAGEVRHEDGPRDHPLFRMHPERWLESIVVTDVSAIDERLQSACLYSQVPAFSASDRAMIDVLTITRDARLAIVELKVEEDLHMPLQALDYWSRVEWHHRRGEFPRFGYFTSRELSSKPPLLFLVAPALHVHPATDTILRYISSEIDWTLVGIDERWRTGVRPVFRKRPGDLLAA